MKSPVSFRFAGAAVALAAGFLLVACGDDRGTGDRPASCPSSFERSCRQPDGTTRCVLVATDPSNCGACGVVCGAGQICMSGACTAPPTDMGGTDGGPMIPSACSPTCPSTQRCCGTTCTNTSYSPSTSGGLSGTMDSSFFNCGGCGIACDATTASQCSTGAGGTRCSCGTLTNPSDPRKGCPDGQVCVANGAGGFVCQTNCGGGGPCTAGNVCCGTGASQACVNTLTDNNNCGRCGNACAAGQGCSGGVCVPLCGGTACRAADMASGFLGEVCCSDRCVPVDDRNCGACGFACTGEDTCGLGGGLFPGTGSSMPCCGQDLFGGGGFGDAGLPFPGGGFSTFMCNSSPGGGMDGGGGLCIPGFGCIGGGGGGDGGFPFPFP